MDSLRRGEEVIGETNATFSPSESGSYAVVITQAGCQDTSGCFNVVVTQLARPTTFAVHVFPNPSQDRFSILLPEGHGAYDVTVTNLWGQTMAKHINLQAGELALDATAWAQGMYLCTIEANAGKTAVKLIRD